MSHLNDQIVRLYDTVFDRAPDPEGLAFWNRVADAGLDLHYMAERFVVAPEFATTYGQPDTLSFVREMYANVLDRPGEAQGVSYWAGVLDAGLTNCAEVVVRFSESPLVDIEYAHQPCTLRQRIPQHPPHRPFLIFQARLASWSNPTNRCSGTSVK